jgi:hypothetical protein
LFGQLKRKKGGVFFLEALMRSGVANKFHVLFVGDMETEMQEWLAAYGKSLAFTVVPFTDRYALLPYYAACDLIAIPSRLKFARSNGFCGHKRKPPIEEAIKKLCSQLA